MSIEKTLWNSEWNHLALQVFSGVMSDGVIRTPYIYLTDSSGLTRMTLCWDLDENTVSQLAKMAEGAKRVWADHLKREAEKVVGVV